jgi:hypothetical protein
MTENEYLKALLDSQTLKDDSDELKKLREHRDDVETLLRDKLGKAKPTIRYAGSYAKGTMIRDSYDLDLTCYVPRDNAEAGSTIAEIHESVRRVLAEKYGLEVKASALRLHSQDGVDFHVDVVPGRYVDDEKADVFLHRTTGDKERLKTNLDIHIEHVRDSGLTDAVRLVKLWRNRNGLATAFKTFVLELATVKLLKDKKSDALSTQLWHVLTTLRDKIDDLVIEDPANPTGNDLSQVFDSVAKAQVKQVAKSSLETYEESGWEAVLGPLPIDEEKRDDAVRRAIGGTRASKPWRK